MMKVFDAIIFDLGGTLIEYAGKYDAWPALEEPGLRAAYLYFRDAGVPVPDFDSFSRAGYTLLPERWQQATSGERNLTVEDFLADILANLSIESPTKSTIKKAARLYESAICSAATPIPHSRETLAQLKADGYKLGLISNTMFSGKAHMADLARFGMEEFFEVRLFSADANAWKPNPEPFWRILNRLNVKPEKTVFIGDDPAADIGGGLQAGLYVVHFVSSDRFPSVDGLIPNATIHSLPELLQLLRRLDSPGPHDTLDSS
jgi:HAD superfamily hydrolase (TIGR01509 family)